MASVPDVLGSSLEPSTRGLNGLRGEAAALPPRPSQRPVRPAYEVRKTTSTQKLVPPVSWSGKPAPALPTPLKPATPLASALTRPTPAPAVLKAPESAAMCPLGA